ncbi:MAG: hypothetical protein JXA69_08840 [Phycisphaerae bacterium]|nr:hypothetical protein [Phycisphaerae bacterium]
MHRSAQVWVNEQLVGEHWGYPVACRFNITPFLNVGHPQVLVIAVDSRRHPERDPLTGTFDVIDFMDLDWGGIQEHISLDCTEDVWVEDVQARPEAADSSATVDVILGRLPDAKRSPLTVTYTVTQWLADGRTGARHDAGEASLPPDTDRVTLALRLANAPLWTPRTPHLLQLRLVLERDGKPIDTRKVRFGQRRLEIRGNDFYLNGERFFLRGYGDDFNFPREILPPASVQYWRDYFQTRKDYGFNGVRHHSMMPTESYLAAADEVGMLVQPELPIAYANFFEQATPAGHELYRQVWCAYIRQMRNHPSVFAWCMGNELWGGFALGPELYDAAKKLDPTRPVIDTDGIVSPADRPTLDYLTYLFSSEQVIPWAQHRGKYTFPAPPPKPVLIHEMGNFVAMPDPTKGEQFNGAVKPFWYEQMKAKVAEQNLESYVPAMVRASQRLQASLLKLNIEAARLSPEIDGYHQWLFRDYWCQSSGFVDMFDQPRALGTAQARQFNADAVLLWDTDRVNYVSGEPIDLEVYLSDFRASGAPEIRDLTVLLAGETVALAPPSEAGGRGLIGPWAGRVPAPTVSTPRKYVLSAHGGGLQNEWAIWVFPPARSTGPDRADVVVTPTLTGAALASLADGGRVWVTDDANVLPTLMATFKTAWWHGEPDNPRQHSFGNMIMLHPAMAGFPHDGYGDLQMYDLLEERPVVLMDALPVRIEPIVWCLDVPRIMRRKAYLFEAKVGKGALLFSTANFAEDVRLRDPAPRWLFEHLRVYVNSDAFQPKAELPCAWLAERVTESP